MKASIRRLRRGGSRFTSLGPWRSSSGARPRADDGRASGHPGARSRWRAASRFERRGRSRTSGAYERPGRIDHRHLRAVRRVEGHSLPVCRVERGAAAVAGRSTNSDVAHTPMSHTRQCQRACTFQFAPATVIYHVAKVTASLCDRIA